MAWGSESLFAGFLEKENSLETLIEIFENVSPKGFFWLNMTDFEISVLTAISRYLQTAALKRGKTAIYLRTEAGRNLPIIRSHSVYDNITIILFLEFKS